MASTSTDPMEKRCRLNELTPMLTCKLCRGYLIDATTVTECLHTFCKSCIVKHLEDANTCPECEDTIHQSHPLDYIAFDRTMQDLVYKIVPNLEKAELERERAFYAERGMLCPKDQMEEELEEKKKEEQEQMTPDVNTNMDYHRFDEQVNLLLECRMGTGSGLKSLKRKYIRCSSLATVTHLRKFIAKKVFNSMEKYKDIDVLCDDEPLYKDHTLKFVYVTRWRTKEPPMKLVFTHRPEQRA